MLVFVPAVLFLVFYVPRHQSNKPALQNRSTITATPKAAETMANSPTPQLKDDKFPDNFFFGSAYSDFQTTGISETSDWYDYVNSVKAPKVGPGIANDLFNRYQEDFRLAGQIGIQVHRISLEWSRIEPYQGVWDKEVIQKYTEIFKSMRANGVEPMICLNHFPLPQWFADLGGWESPDAPKLYARYAEYVAKNFGKPMKVKWWLTFNEPQYVIEPPYISGTWPPFKNLRDRKDSEGTKRVVVVVSHVLDAHRLAYRSIHKVLDHKNHKPMVGFASAVGAFYPLDPKSSLDQLAYNTFNTFRTLFLDYAIGTSDRDFIGINYYGRFQLKLHISIGQQILAWLNSNRPFDIQWITPKPQGKRPIEFYPQGLYETIMKFKDLGLPIVITENGIDDPSDNYREEFITIHLKAILNAIRDGADVRGYQYWALADTWEPGDLRFSQMGLIKIDRGNNLGRSLRPSSKIYAEIIKTHTLSKELQEKHSELLPR